MRSCLAILVLATAISVDAATITVNSFSQIDIGQCTIATAIASINAAADQPGCTHSGSYGTSDTIVLASGTYATTVADNGTNAYPIIQKALTINGNGATLSRTVGNIAPFFRFFEVEGGGLTLNNTTLTGGNLPNGNGGAIYHNIGPFVVSGSTFSNNTAPNGDGGAIYHNSTEAASISNSTFSNNSGPWRRRRRDLRQFNERNDAHQHYLHQQQRQCRRRRRGFRQLHQRAQPSVTERSRATRRRAATAALFTTTRATASCSTAEASPTAASARPAMAAAIYDNSTGGIQISNVVFSGNTATGGDGGAIYDNTDAGGPASNNCFVGNTATTGGGLFRGTTPALNAINNWWGSASGPSGAGPGTGDSVSSNVTFSPFLTSPPGICGGAPPPPPTSEPIPTLSDWALWTMGLLLLAGGMWGIRRHVR